ncbi:MAG: terminase small subunit, partial [Burkholderiales bacterium]|nr:terminase small subunit [Burkholderiales bacterium]
MSDNGLTNKQRAFIESYLQCWNATQAARDAKYEGNDVTLASVGYENLRKPQIRERIKQRLNTMAMSADEVLARLSEQARGDIG